MSATPKGLVYIKATGPVYGGRTAGTVTPPPTYATAFTITLSASSGATGSPVTVTVTPTGGQVQSACTVTLACSTATLGTTSLSFSAGATAAQATTLTPAADGTHSVSMTNDLGLANTGSPRTYTSTTSGSLTVGAQVATLNVYNESGTGARPFTATVLPLRGVVPSGSTLTDAAGAAQTISGVQLRKSDSGLAVSSADSNTFTIQINSGSTPVAFTGTVPGQVGTIGSAFSLALVSYFSGSLTPFTYSVLSGSLPAGLSLNTSTGAITGTPTTAGSSSAVIRATDTGTNTAQTGSISFTISASVTPVSFSGPVPAQTATQGSSYSLALAPYFSGSETPFTYSVLSGALPTGLSLNASTGVISGTPSAAGSFSAVVRATDTATNTAQTGSIAFTVGAPGTYPVLIGEFAANTGSLARAAGEAFDWWAIQGVYIGGDLEPATRLRGSGTLDADGMAPITLTAAGYWEVQIRFPNDPGAAGEKGTARQTVTVP